MPKGDNNMDNKYDEQFLTMQSTIESDRQESDEKITNLTFDLKEIITLTIKSMMAWNNNSKSSQDKKDSPKPPEPTYVVPTNRRSPPLDDVHNTRIGGMWTLNHDISSPKLYELIFKTELK